MLSIKNWESMQRICIKTWIDTSENRKYRWPIAKENLNYIGDHSNKKSRSQWDTICAHSTARNGPV